ncbi:MAG: amidohydrolase [Gammaproteobacteria bacterium]|nr:amidohydrolase [Gammaproteobacteria bacterium]
MSRSLIVLCMTVNIVLPLPALTQNSTLLLRNTTLYTASRGSIEPLLATDILVQDGRITNIGQKLTPPIGVPIIDAQGRSVTPGLFGGLGRIGLEEIGLEPSTGDYAQRLGQMRPEFDVSLAYNPESMSLGVHRSNGITFAMLAPSSETNSSIIAGLGAPVSLNGSAPSTARSMFIDLGGDSNHLSGGSRAAQFMLLRQAVIEARAPNLVMVHDERLLTPAGRQTLIDFLKGSGPFVFDVDRASDIRQTIAFVQAEKISAIIRGGGEAWRVAAELAAAHIPVILDPLNNLPASFDLIGATLENAARLRAAGVTVAISMRSPGIDEAARIRQAAGNAVAHGLSWADGLAAITRIPAEIFGVADRFGVIEKGRLADLVLWSGDPLDVTSLPELVLASGKEQSLQSRQTALRDRYFERLKQGTAH